MANSLEDQNAYYSKLFDVYCEFNENAIDPLYRLNVQNNKTKQIIETTEWHKEDDLYDVRDLLIKNQYLKTWN
jgi:hypothetical protein